MPTTALIGSDTPSLPPIPPSERVTPAGSTPGDRRDRRRPRRKRPARREPQAPERKRRDEGKGEHVDIHA